MHGTSSRTPPLSKGGRGSARSAMWFRLQSPQGSIIMRPITNNDPAMTLHFNNSESKIARRQLRAGMPPAEVILWSKKRQEDAAAADRAGTSRRLGEPQGTPRHPPNPPLAKGGSARRRLKPDSCGNILFQSRKSAISRLFPPPHRRHPLFSPAGCLRRARTAFGTALTALAGAEAVLGGGPAALPASRAPADLGFAGV